MPNSVLIFQSDPSSAQTLSDYFTRRGDKVWLIKEPSQAEDILQKNIINLAVVDLHAPGNGWLELIGEVKRRYPDVHLIATNKVPDVRREWLAKGQGVKVFLREPFSPAWIERAIKRLEAEKRGKASVSPNAPPKVRVSVRTKLTFPYAVLALLFVLAGAYLILRFVQDSAHERFTNQLYDAARLSSDWMVGEERRLLETLRLLAHTQGVPQAIQAADTARLRELVLPAAINSNEEAVDILNMQGVSLLSLHHRSGSTAGDYEASQGDNSFATWDFVRKVMALQADQTGDKFAGLALAAWDPTGHAAWGDMFYIAGPVLDDQNKPVGILLVGKSLKTLAAQNRENTLAQVSFYSKSGTVLASTLFLIDEIRPLPQQTVSDVLAWQDQRSFLRDLSLSGVANSSQPSREMAVASSTFTELLSPWEARNGEDLGVVGVALTENFQVLSNEGTRLQAVLLVIIAFLCVVGLGLILASQLTRPLSRIVQASTKVAQGDLEVKVPAAGNDEVAVVAHAFNYMVSGLQEGLIYRELLGRTVSPEVREALRHSFESGKLRLEGQNRIATVLMTDIRGFTTISEKQEPTTILTWLNEYFGELAPVVEAHGGVVDKFEGDAMLAFFGILPTPLPPEDSAFMACEAIAELLKVIDRINLRRKGRGEPPLITGISAHTGPLIAGGLGASDRMNYTIIGDTVNTTQRMQDITRKFGETGAVVGENTMISLGGRRGQFRFEPLGEHTFPGKRELLWVYRLRTLEPGGESLPGNGNLDKEREALSGRQPL